VLTGGFTSIEVNGGSGYVEVGAVEGGKQEFFISGYEEGKDYNVRIRHYNRFRIASSGYNEVTAHTLSGKTTAPNDVTGVSATGTQEGIEVTWTNPSDRDLGRLLIERARGDASVRGVLNGTYDWTPIAVVPKGEKFVDTFPYIQQSTTLDGLIYRVTTIDTSGNEGTAVENLEGIVEPTLPSAHSNIVYSSANPDTISSVNTGANEITMAEAHNYRTAAPIYFNGVLGGLTAGTVYYAIVTDTNKLKLATSEANALAGTAVVLTSFSSGSLTILYGYLTYTETNDENYFWTKFRYLNQAGSNVDVNLADIRGTQAEIEYVVTDNNEGNYSASQVTRMWIYSPFNHARLVLPTQTAY